MLTDVVGEYYTLVMEKHFLRAWLSTKRVLPRNAKSEWQELYARFVAGSLGRREVYRTVDL
jgi:hypothetical protein